MLGRLFDPSVIEGYLHRPFKAEWPGERGSAGLAVPRTVEHTADQAPDMETIRVVLDKQLLAATDRAAGCSKRSRSALIREALRQHLRNLRIRELEERDRQGHSTRPQSSRESDAWEAEAAWPQD